MDIGQPILAAGGATVPQLLRRGQTGLQEPRESGQGEAQARRIGETNQQHTMHTSGGTYADTTQESVADIR
ncbi:hypothetical protein PG993_008708 [Apiospora rasikravindrae]|uniref:Uncharacterized protein n=1 Tax=Apiospora rasikravindrae TaxID=990691 RepID=A0ABR1SQV0_9PEZI